VTFVLTCLDRDFIKRSLENNIGLLYFYRSLGSLPKEIVGAGNIEEAFNGLCHYK
jgi:hypothetical protein